MEKDDEVKGVGNSYTTLNRQYDSRIGRWMGIDPVEHAWQSPYTGIDNNPIILFDPNGDCPTCDKQGTKYDVGATTTETNPETGAKTNWLMTENGWQDITKWHSGMIRGKTVWSNIDLWEDLPALSGHEGYTYDEEDLKMRYWIRNSSNSCKQFKYALEEFENAGWAEPLTKDNYYNTYGHSLGTLKAWGTYSNFAATLGYFAFTMGGNITGPRSLNTKLYLNKGISLKNYTPQNGPEFSSHATSITEGRISIIGRSKTHGQFDFIITNKGELRIGTGHYYLSGGASSVRAAGRIKLYNGKVTRITNWSGHYKPTIGQGRTFGDALQSRGVDVSGAKLRLYNRNGDLKTTTVLQ